MTRVAVLIEIGPQVTTQPDVFQTKTFPATRHPTDNLFDFIGHGKQKVSINFKFSISDKAKSVNERCS